MVPLEINLADPDIPFPIREKDLRAPLLIALADLITPVFIRLKLFIVPLEINLAELDIPFPINEKVLRAPFPIRENAFPIPLADLATIEPVPLAILPVPLSTLLNPLIPSSPFIKNLMLLDNPFARLPSPPVTRLNTFINPVNAIMLKPTSVIVLSCAGDSLFIDAAILVTPFDIIIITGVNASPSFIELFCNSIKAFFSLNPVVLVISLNDLSVKPALFLIFPNIVL